MRTVYDPTAAAFSELAHLAARKAIYEPMFPNGVDYEDVTLTAQDLNYAIDRQLVLIVPSLRAPIRLSVQERFRDPGNMWRGDITVTEWNLASDLPSELHKLAAQLFVYGFYDERKAELVAGAVVDVARLLVALAQDRLPWTRGKRPGGDQTFLCFRIDDLAKVGAVIWKFTTRPGQPSLFSTAGP